MQNCSVFRDVFVRPDNTPFDEYSYNQHTVPYYYYLYNFLDADFQLTYTNLLIYVYMTLQPIF